VEIYRVRQLPHILGAALGVLALAAPVPTAAQTSLSAYDAVREALVAVWDELPLSVRGATLVEGTPAGLGQFQRRSGNAFKPDEAVTVYAELYGYGVLPRADGGYVRELSADLALVDATGAVRANQIGFWRSSEVFAHRPLEMHLSFSATLSAFPSGDYTLRFTVHDEALDRQASFELPIVLSGE
jgi:hypothetical protein